MCADFNRERDGFRFRFLGLKTNLLPDALPDGKYAFAQNVRSTREDAIQTRPGMLQLFEASSPRNVPFTDIATYAALGTDTLPRTLAFDALGGVWLDNGTNVTTMAVSASGAVNGATLLPFRPAESPNPWMYIADGFDYQKFSAPASNIVTAQKVGIAEPQSSPDASPTLLGFSQFNLLAADWANTGTAGTVSDTQRSTDTVGASFADPVTDNRWYLQVATSGSVEYSVGELTTLTVGDVGTFLPVEDVLPAISPSGSMTIQGISYYSGGSTGHCVVVPTQGSVAGAVPSFSGNDPSSGSIFTEDLLASLRRGSIVQFSGSSEICLVYSVTRGPNGTICFETITTGAHIPGETITGLYSIAVSNTNGVCSGGNATGKTLTSASLTSSISVGIGILEETSGALVAAAFANPYASNNAVAPQSEDYLTVSVFFDDPTKLVEAKLLIDVGDGSFTQNYYYYTIRPSDLTDALANAQTQLAAAQVIAQRALIDAEQAIADPNQVSTTVSTSGSQAAPGLAQWTDIRFPMTAFTRVGNDQTLTLANANNVQLSVNVSDTVSFVWGGLYTSGGGQPDVGDIGSPLFYRVRPRSQVTGVVGNPSPATRYGVSPRRQPVVVDLPSAAYDSQIDTWDIFRYGGAVTSWRFVGEVASSTTVFIDNYDDAAAQAGNALDFDNFEPWPTIDYPLSLLATEIAGTNAIVKQVAPPNPNILRYLPGNLVLVPGGNVYTLWARPTQLSTGIFGTFYLFQFVENAGALTNAQVQIYEPEMARQFLPYMFGPDSAGTIFACGDSLRPGTLSFSKSYAPDSAPDSYNEEITTPEEPLLGGEILDGLALVASSARWWALYPQTGNPDQRYSTIQQPFTRGLAAPFGHCNDGRVVYWWAKDGIYASDKGSLTDADLYNLFPHEGVPGTDVTYSNLVVHAPDYSRAATFRLAYSNGYLYATYQDSFGAYRCLTYDTRHSAWCDDVWGNGVSTVYAVPQPPGTLGTETPSLYPSLLLATNDAASPYTPVVASMQQGVNDINTPISVLLATREYDGGDIRAPKQWGDLFLDLIPAATSGVGATLMSLGVPVANASPFPIPSSTTRQRIPLSAGSTGPLVEAFLGVLLDWTDDYAHQTVPTRIHIWQPTFTIQPASAIEWITFGSAFGLEGYHHIRQLSLAWVSTAAATLTITSVDGQSPAQVITLPSTGGKYFKQTFPVAANKGLLHVFHFKSASTSNPLQLFMDDSEVYVGAWGRDGAYLAAKNFGGDLVRGAVL